MVFVHIVHIVHNFIIAFGDLFLFEGSEPEMDFNPSSKVGDHVTILMMFS